MDVGHRLLTAGRRLGVWGSRSAPYAIRGRATAAAAAEDVASDDAPSSEWQKAKPFDDIPGPEPLPLIGNLWRFLPVIGEWGQMDLLAFNAELRRRYGNIVRLDGILGRTRSVLLFDGNDIEKAFRNEGQWPMRSGQESMLYYRKMVRPEWFRDRWGVAFSQGKEWFDFRQKVNQVMMQPRSAKLYVGPIDQVAADFVQRMLQMRDEKLEMPKDFINELHKWALESVALIALDARLGCLEPNLAPDSDTQRMIDSVQILFESIFKMEFGQSAWKYFSTPTWRKFTKAMDYFHEIAERHINAAMERIKAKTAASCGDLSVLERLIINNDDPGVACVMALDMMFAGIDTTGNAAASVLQYLAQYPEVQGRLFQELYSQLPESPSQPLTSAKLEECRYLKACVRESLRMRPIAPANMRRCLVDNVVLSGYRIPKGVDMIMGHAHLSLSPEHFPEPNQFRPERWLKGPDGKSETQAAHPFASLPFGFGPRMCIGRRFAELEIYTLVARVIRRFHLEYDGDAQWGTGLVLYPASPLNFRALDRDR